MQMSEAKNFKSKVIVFGSTGMLGHDLLKQMGSDYTVIAPDEKEVDLTNWTMVENFFKRIRYADFVINCAAYTLVDKCEENSNLAFAINASGTQIIAKCCERMRIPMLHVSTDYVFDGKKELYTVSDVPIIPETIYGRSKLLGEQYVQQIANRYFIVRTSWLYGQYGNNFVHTILRLSQQDGPLKIVNDQIGCPTYTIDLAKAMISLIGSENYGIHHASGEGYCSWFEFAKKTLQIKNISKEIIPISTKKSFDLFPQIKAKRPMKSILKNTLSMRHWEKALEDYLKEAPFENSLDK